VTAGFVIGARAIGRWIEDRIGRPVRKFVRTVRRYRTVKIQAGPHAMTTADPLLDDLRHGLETIARSSRGAH
jgi:hypothetical protein